MPDSAPRRPDRRRFLALAAAGFASPLRAESAPTIAVAANLHFAMAEIAAAFRAETGGELRLIYGASGNFVRQIRQGAPFEMFLSADEEFPALLIREGLARAPAEIYANGRLALILPRGGDLAADGSLAALGPALASGRVGRFAIASPEHAPYGRLAEAALKQAGLWEAVRPRLVIGENVSQAAQFVASGNAEAGLVAYSLAISAPVAATTRHALVPAAFHPPLPQAMVLTKRASPPAARFFAFMAGEKARAILERHGFAPPGA